MICFICDTDAEEHNIGGEIIHGEFYCANCADQHWQDQADQEVEQMPEPAPFPAPTDFYAAIAAPFKTKRRAPALDEEGEYNMPAIPAKEGFKFGCDPEGFIRDPEGRLVSAALILPGTKADPYPVEGGAVQVDGMAAEFNIDPVTNFEDWNANIKNVIRQLEGMLPPGHTLDWSPSVVFPEDVFNTAPDIAKELGCSPDFNAWTGEINPPPSDPENPYMRCAAGHIHIGWTEGETPDNLQHIMNCNDLVKQLDWYLGGWSTKMDSDPTRRRLYGRAGACRYKPYGVEYRVLSNFWVGTRDRRLSVWNRLQQGIHDMRQGFLPDRARGNNYMLVEMINQSKADPNMTRVYRFPLSTLDASYARL